MYSEFKSVSDFQDQCGYMIDGVWYPRVTKIVGIKAKPALYRYYAEASSYQAAQNATEQSAKEGIAIHEAVEALLLGQNPVISPDIAPAVASFVDFYNRNHIHVTPELVERRIISKDHRYAGTVDAIALIGGKMGVLDIKTSQSVYRDYSLQTSAYMHALHKEFPALETRWILRLDQNQHCANCSATRRMKGGREKIKTDWRDFRTKTCQHVWNPMIGEAELVECPGWQNDFSAFLGAKRLWEWENEDWLKRVGYLS